jgi:sulfite reductase alpha subunit-like flavoprotein
MSNVCPCSGHTTTAPSINPSASGPPRCGHADVWRWLEDGAHFYVCGDASRMSKDVDDALTAVIRTHGGLSGDAAHEYRRELVATKRYVRDVY